MIQLTSPNSALLQQQHDESATFDPNLADSSFVFDSFIVGSTTIRPDVIQDRSDPLLLAYAQAKSIDN